MLRRYAHLYKQCNKKVWIIVNGTEEDFATTELESQNVEFFQMYAISRTSGKKLAVEYELSDNKLIMQVKNEHLTTQMFILE